MSTSPKESPLDDAAVELLQESLYAAQSGADPLDFDIELDNGVYLGFDTVENSPDDRLGHAYVYVADFVYHARDDEDGSPHDRSLHMYGESQALSALSSQLRDIIYDVVGSDQPFVRQHSVSSLERGGGTYYVSSIEQHSSEHTEPEPPSK